jgi:hypothetical protein
LRRFSKIALRPVEMLVLYVMLSISSAIASVDFLDVLVPMLGHAARFATSENRWADRMLPLLPNGIFVKDREALSGWYEGNSTLYTRPHLLAWAAPVLIWTAFVTVLLFTMLCMNLVLRRRWIEEERLTYPVTQLPLEIADPRSVALKSRMLWIGAGIAGGIALLNGIAVYLPNVPTVYVRQTDLAPYITSRPWSAMGWTPISFYPFAIGLAYLLPLDLLFSCWFFYFFLKAERIATAAMGWDSAGSAMPYTNQQMFGAYVGIALAALWMGRRHIAQAIFGHPARDDSLTAPASRNGFDPLSPRFAAVGAAAGFAVLSIFFSALGLPLWIAALAFALYFAICVGVTRMRAELGPPAHDLHYAGPDVILTTTLGASFFAPSQLAVLTLFYWFNRAYRSLPMPHQLEAFKMAERRRVSPVVFLLPMMLAAPLGSLAGFWAHLHNGYSQGASAKLVGHLVGFGWEAFGRLDSWLASPKSRDLGAMAAIGAGIAFTLLLQTLALRVSGWPFHPLGYALAGSWSMNTIWLPIFIAWVAKSLLCRYGGLKAHRMALPFFYGLILGDYVMGCAWGLIGWLFGVPYYTFQQ